MKAYTMVRDAFEESPLPAGMNINGEEIRCMLKLRTITPGTIMKDNAGTLYRVHETMHGDYQLFQMKPQEKKRKARYTKVEKPLGILTGRERETMLLIVQGLSTREMAIIMGISERTIMAHVSEIKSKLQVESREGAVGTAFLKKILVVVDGKPVFADEVK